MSAEFTPVNGRYVRALRCDEVTPDGVCPAELVAEVDVLTFTALRTVAHRDHQWSTRRGDHCPAHRPTRDLRPGADAARRTIADRQEATS
ncbi:MAG: hypothetical protein ACRDQ0_01840 [Pseudonocardia sp.]